MVTSFRFRLYPVGTVLGGGAQPAAVTNESDVAGAVVRVGGHVLRPSNPYSLTIHRFLAALRDAGFDGASVPVGIDADGRERLVFIEGDVPISPFPEWAQADAAPASLVALIRRSHDASRSFDPGGLVWSSELADPAGGPIVCHNDVCLENALFRDGVAVGLLDFDFAAPGRPVYDLVQFARMCVPVDGNVVTDPNFTAQADTAEGPDVLLIGAHQMYIGGNFSKVASTPVATGGAPAKTRRPRTSSAVPAMTSSSTTGTAT